MGLPRLGRFQAEALLGQGQVTETFCARLAGKTDDGARFIVKLLRSQSGSDERALAARFIEGARRLAALSLPAFVRVVELGEGPGPVYAAWDMKPGVDLSALRRQAAPTGALDLRMVALLGRKMAERLAPLHARTAPPRVHGGLSPGNVLVSPEGEIFFLECGLAEAIRPLCGDRIEPWVFCAPEQLRGEPATVASDLYSLGALIHFLYLGQAPFEGRTREELEAAIANGPPSLGDAPATLNSLVTRLLAWSPEARPQSAVEVARQIAVAMMASAVAPQAVASHAPEAERPSVGSTPRQAARSTPGLASVVASPVPQSAAAPPPKLPSTPEPARASSGARPPGRSEVTPEHATTRQTPRPAVTAERALSAAGSEAVVPFSLDEEGPAPVEPPIRPFRVDDDEGDEPRVSDISADDPDVGVVYDDEDEDDFDVGADGKVKRRRRGRLNLPAWYRSEVARRIFRYWWAPVAGLLISMGVLGYFWNKQWQAARADSQRRSAAQAAQAAREAAALKGPAAPTRKPLSPGRLEVVTRPASATVWLDGIEKGHTPIAITTEPGAHRLVITLPGYRMLRDVVATANGVHFERELLPAPAQTGSVPLAVGCATEDKYPVFVDGRDVGALCPTPSLGVEPGRHVIGIFVIPQNRSWTFEREVQAGRPHRVQFSY